jgi:hypothetical protein
MVASMQRLNWTGMIAAAGMVLALLAGPVPSRAQSDGQPAVADAPAGGGSGQAPAEIHLYFADAQKGVLKAEKRLLTTAGHPAETGRAIAEQLIQGPQSNLAPTVPSRARLKSFYLTPDGTAYVNLDSEIRSGHPGGVQMEMLTLFSIVNSLVLNVPEIQRVRILIDGREVDTLAGHIDIRQPFKANMLIIR